MRNSSYLVKGIGWARYHYIPQEQIIVVLKADRDVQCIANCLHIYMRIEWLSNVSGDETNGVK